MLHDNTSPIVLFNKDKYIKIYKGKAFSYRDKTPSKKNKKVIVFDLDETIGSFGELYILWNILQNYGGNYHLFDELLDLYPEFLRHGILNILEFLYHKKTSGECSRIFIYTNNQCRNVSSILSLSESDSNLEHFSWVQLICVYLKKKIGAKTDIFDKIIGAFKIDGQIVEFSRTTTHKTLGDFGRCAVIPKGTEICFIDNTYYPNMVCDRVYYIKPLSYTHCLPPSEIINRFSNSALYKDLDKSIDPDLDSCLQRAFQNKRVNDSNLETDLAISQKLMYYLKEFFYLSTRKVKTRKFLIKMGKFTRKKK